MKRPLRGDMPLALTLPLHFDLGLRARRRRLRRLLLGALALAVAALLATGVWLPARAALVGAERAEQAPDLRETPFSLADLAIGDSFPLERANGVVRTYEVIALDIVDSRRVEFEPDTDGRTVALTGPWPLDGTPVAGQWRYVVTAQLRF